MSETPRHYLTCEACNGDYPPNEVTGFGGIGTEAQVSLCVTCQELATEECDVELSGDLLSKEDFDALSGWSTHQRENLPPVAPAGVPADSLILRMIDGFEAECKERDYTDTDKVWEIFRNIRNLLACKQVEGPIVPSRESVAEQVAMALSNKGVVCWYELQPGFVAVPLVNGFSWAIGQANECWSGDLHDKEGSPILGCLEENYYQSEIPSDSTDVERIATSIKAFLDRWCLTPETAYKRNVKHPQGAS